MIAIVAVLLAAEIARMTVAARLADDDSQLAFRLAPNSPLVLASAAMREVGEAAAKRRNPSELTFRKLRKIAEIAPLRPEPFLVEGAVAEKQGDLPRAEALFRQARRRDPRSTAARYLLADVWLREGKTVDALGEMAILARLWPRASLQLVPALSEYVRQAGASKQLRKILERNPGLKRPLLTALSADPANAATILELAGADVDSSAPEAKRWQSRLLQGFVNAGAYDRAYTLWRRFGRVTTTNAPLVFNGGFKESMAPPPFNWTYSSGGAGISEPAEGKLRIVFYGRTDAVLASQLLLLQPGVYQFHAPATGNVAENALEWTLNCDSSSKRLMEMGVGTKEAAVFAVPPACRAQRLELVGHSQNAQELSDVRIGPLAIERARRDR